MLFKRRKQPEFWDRLRVWLWPRRSWRRSALYYLKRTLRLTGTPYAIAMGIAIGAFASITPFVGLHLFITAVIAWLFGANMIAGAIGTAVGNPLTFPFIWATTYELGNLILKGGGSHQAPARLGYELTHRSFDQLVPLLKPMLVGSVPLGLSVAIVCYIIVYKAVSSYQEARKRRLSGANRMVESGQKP